MSKEKKRPGYWSHKELGLLKKLRPDNTLDVVHKQFKIAGFNRSRKAIERKCESLSLKYNVKKAEKEKKVKDQENRVRQQKIWDQIVKIKRRYTKQPIETRERGLIKTSEKLRKILVLSDFHIPFERDDLIMEAIDDHKDADILVLNGDILDTHAVSTWPKDKTIPLQSEYKITMEYMKIFASRFPKVVLVRGNHEYRLNSYFHKHMNPEVSFLVNKELLSHISSGNIYDDDGNVVEKLDFKNVYFVSGTEAWFFKVGKTIFCHPLSFSKVDGKTGVMSWEYFMDREDVDSVVTAHTHAQIKNIKKGRLVIEQGCMCVPLDYAKQGKLTYGPQTLGYSIIYQDQEGNTDFNLSRIVFQGIQYPIKKSFEELLEEEETSNE